MKPLAKGHTVGVQCRNQTHAYPRLSQASTLPANPLRAPDLISSGTLLAPDSSLLLLTSFSGVV